MTPWITVGLVPLHWGWLVLLSGLLEQAAFERRGYAPPMPTFRRLVAFGDEIFVQELVSGAAFPVAERIGARVRTPTVY